MVTPTETTTDDAIEQVVDAMYEVHNFNLWLPPVIVGKNRAKVVELQEAVIARYHEKFCVFPPTFRLSSDKQEVKNGSRRVLKLAVSVNRYLHGAVPESSVIWLADTSTWDSQALSDVRSEAMTVQTNIPGPTLLIT